MKSIIITCVFMAFATFSKAQLTNTKWAGDMNIPTTTDITLKFSTDTISIIYEEQAVEVMSYTTHGDTIIAKKISGHSPCDVGQPFKLKYVIKNDKLFITSLQDDCDERSQAFFKDPFTKAKD